MTTYGKPRWPNKVLFGSHRELNYRIDIITGTRPLFVLTTSSGPGFRVRFERAQSAPFFKSAGPVPAKARARWLENPACREALRSLLELHFSALEARESFIQCLSSPERDDLIPEGPQLTWCLSQIYLLWSAVPEEERRRLTKSEFVEEKEMRRGS